MKKSIIWFSLFILLAAVSTVLADTNPKWMTTITITPASPSSGELVTFSATFRAARGDIDNLKVVAGVEGVELFNTTYPRLIKSQDTVVSFSWVAVPGTHTVYFQIDPDETSADILRSDNRLEQTITIGGAAAPEPRYLPNLIIPRALVSWSPFFFKAGDPVTINYTVNNIGEGDSGTFHVGLRVGSSIVQRNSFFSLISGVVDTGSFVWTATCDGEPAIVADCDNEESETNETDNVYTNSYFKCAVPDVRVYDMACSSGSNSVPSGAPYQYTALLKVSDAMGVSNLRVVGGIVGGETLLDTTFPTVAAGATQIVSFVKTLPVGSYTFYFDADPDNTISESDESNNRVTLEMTSTGRSDERYTPGITSKINLKLELILTRRIIPAEYKVGDIISVNVKVTLENSSSILDVPIILTGSVQKSDLSKTWKLPTQTIKLGKKTNVRTVIFKWQAAAGGSYEMTIQGRLETGHEVDLSDNEVKIKFKVKPKVIYEKR